MAIAAIITEFIDDLPNAWPTSTLAESPKTTLIRGILADLAANTVCGDFLCSATITYCESHTQEEDKSMPPRLWGLRTLRGKDGGAGSPRGRERRIVDQGMISNQPSMLMLRMKLMKGGTTNNNCSPSLNSTLKGPIMLLLKEKMTLRREQKEQRKEENDSQKKAESKEKKGEQWTLRITSPRMRETTVGRIFGGTLEEMMACQKVQFFSFLRVRLTCLFRRLSHH